MALRGVQREGSVPLLFPPVGVRAIDGYSSLPPRALHSHFGSLISLGPLDVCQITLGTWHGMAGSAQ